MSGPATPCEWCGGPTVWTIMRGEVYVSCDSGCLPLPLEGLVPPTDSELPERLGEVRGRMELERGGGVMPLEGGDAKTSGTEVEWPGDPPQAFFDTMWESDDGTR